jgi:hypothetical protein
VVKEGRVKRFALRNGTAKDAARLQDALDLAQRKKWAVEMLQHGIGEDAVKGSGSEWNRVGIPEHVRGGACVIDGDVGTTKVLERGCLVLRPTAEIEDPSACEEMWRKRREEFARVAKGLRARIGDLWSAKLEAVQHGA